MTEQDMEKANALLGEAVLLRARKRLKEALGKCQEALLLLPGNAEAFDIMGDLYLESGLTEAAIEAYKRVLELDPSRADAVELKIARAALKQARIDGRRKLARDLVEGRVKRIRGPNPTATGLLSLLFPGLGQAYNQQWPKALGFACAFLFFARQVADGAGAIIKARFSPPSTPSISDLFGAFFTPPVLWWTLLLTALYIYSVVDAALVAVHSVSEETDLI
jgi:tetratricopeptide (TPR) repeat protein